MTKLRPFWRYYGGKWRAAPRYPSPRHGRIVEPFAGSAGYALRHPDLEVTLIDAYPVVAGIWSYLIRVPAAEVLRIPSVDRVDDLPPWVPQEARDLVGFCLSSAVTSPRRTLSAGRKNLRDMGRRREGWSEDHRALVASQVDRIRHWRITCGDYTEAPSVRATWFVDPPYNNAAGAHYVHGPDSIDYARLAQWCRSRDGRVIVCENEGADWLPFEPFAVLKAGISRRGMTAGSREVIWAHDSAVRQAPRQLSLRWDEVA